MNEITNSNKPEIKEIISGLETKGSTEKIDGKIKSVKINKRFLLGFLAGIVIIIIAIVGIFGVGLYAYGWNDAVTNKVTKIIPYPAALVNYNIISFGTYRDDVATMVYYYNQQKNNGGAAVPDQATIGKNVLNRLVNNELSIEAAKRYDLGVTSAEVENELNKFRTEVGGEDKVKQTLTNLYNWSEDQFKAKVLEPFLLNQKLAIAISNDEGLNGAARQKAALVLGLVKEGKINFNDLAKQYSEDSTARAGGDIGSLDPALLPAAISDQVKNLKVGEVSGLIKSDFGFHIFKRLESEKGKEAKQMHLAQIFVQTKNLDTFLAEEQAKASVWLLAK